MENLRWLTRKYLQERFEEHNLKVSCLYPEVHDRLKNQTFPAPLLPSISVYLFSAERLVEQYPRPRIRYDTSGEARKIIIFANRLDPDQTKQNVEPDLDPKCLTL